jgi:small subunit ribosomal protein S13
MSQEFRHIVRIAGTDLDGSVKLPYALADIEGVGIRSAYAAIKITGLDPELRTGYLTESQAKELERVIQDMSKVGVPSWLLNRRKDISSGKDIHVIGPDLKLTNRMDIERMKATKSWKGIRHALGLKVRGQHTRTTGRTGQTVGVSKKKARASK